MLFYIIMAADAFLSVLILSDSIRSGPLVRCSSFHPTRRPLSLPFLTALPPCVPSVNRRRESRALQHRPSSCRWSHLLSAVLQRSWACGVSMQIA
jgi:hypothetical protein